MRELHNSYFAIYLDDVQNKKVVSGNKAKEIAITCDGTDFDDSIFNEYEKANLEILADLDTY